MNYLEFVKDIKEKDEFRYWLASMDDVLGNFIDEFYEDKKYKFDYSKESLNTLESLILEKFDNIKKIQDKKYSIDYDKYVRYLGETLRKNLNLKWALDIEDSKSAYYKLPILIENSDRYTPVCPHKLITACIARNKGNFLITILENLKKEKADL